ncbi:MAG: hypothetical protein ABI128_12020 [Rhodanobacter sp.]
MVRSSRDPSAIHVFEFHPHIKWVPIACALASGMPFAVRGLLVQIGLHGHARRRAVRQWQHSLSVDPRRLLQINECFGAVTTLHPSLLGVAQTMRIFGTPRSDISQLDLDEERLPTLRATLMNSSLSEQENCVNSMGGYFDLRDRRVPTLLDHSGIKP